jgi:pimeloyl-ACP methyl ester carboxylesterase/AraC-like DNA-binding protein
VSLVLELGARAARPERPAGGARKRPPPWLRRALDFAHDNFRGPICIGDMARAAGVRPAHLAAVFRKVHRIPLGTYVRRLRVDWVAEQLIRTDAPITLIAAEAGFADQAHLTRVFRRALGSTPRGMSKGVLIIVLQNAVFDVPVIHIQHCAPAGEALVSASFGEGVAMNHATRVHPKRRQPQSVNAGPFLKAAVLLTGIFALSIPHSANGQVGAGLNLEPHVFVTATGDSVDAQRGRLRVPENRADPNSRTIDLQFVRFAATTEDPGPPIVYLAGGPGGSGIAAARSARFPLFMALREVADVIALDQRGTGTSAPDLSCPASDYVYPLDQPGTRESWLALERRAAAACIDSIRSRGIDPYGYTTAESANDLDALRRALAAERISLLGISYGTHLGLSAIKRHPGRIHRAILAGIEGPDHTFMLPSAQQRHLEFLAAASRKDPVAAHVPDLLATMNAVFSRLASGPVTMLVPGGRDRSPDTVVVGAFDVQVRTAMALHTRNWDVPRIYHQMANGDFSFVAEFMRDFRRFQGADGLTLLMECASSASAERLRQIQRERESTLLGDARNFPFPEVCDVVYERVPGLRLPESFRAPLRADVPVLLISGTHDGVTPFSNALEVAAGLSNGRHLLIQGAEHSDDLLISSPLIARGMIEFLRGRPVTHPVVAVPFAFAMPNRSDSLP